MPRLTRFTSELDVVRSTNYHTDEFVDALAGSTSLTALRVRSNCHRKVNELLNVYIEASAPRLRFIVVGPSMEMRNVQHRTQSGGLSAKFTNLVGCYGFRGTDTGVPFTNLSAWFYMGIWLRGEGRGSMVLFSRAPSSTAGWVTHTAPCWVFQRVVLALLGFLRRDGEAHRFDPDVLARWL